jgi:hypothetical protein
MPPRVQAKFPRYNCRLPDIREQAKNCIEKVRFLLKMPPVRAFPQGGNVFVLPGAAYSIRGEKVSKTDPKARGRG